MRINLKALSNMGYECHANEEIIEIYPKKHRDISDEIQALTDLPRRDCYILIEDIQEMQIINAIKHTS